MGSERLVELQAWAREVQKAYDEGYQAAQRDAEEIWGPSLHKAETALEAFREIHDYHCGCEQPGRLDLCVAKPTSVFGVLR